MDARIILAGQGVDAVGALDAGRIAAQGQIGLNRENALAALYSSQGPGIMAGDPNAMNALARMDPNAAMGVQQNRLGMQGQQLDMDATRQRMSILDEQTKRDAEEYARSIGAAKAAQEAAELEGAVKQALTAPTPEAFDAMMTQMGRPEMVGQFANRDQLAAQFMSVADILKMNAPPTPLSPEGKLAADIAAGVVPRGTVPQPGVSVVNNMGEGDKFYNKLDEKAAERFDTLMNDGIQAGRTLGLIDRLDGLLKTTPTGGTAVFTKLAGEVGIDIGGLGDVQAVQALINQIVPQQRQPGSGPMSDADLALFKQSVPRLINQPGGNQLIVETMREINKYVMQQAEIASAVADRQISPAEGRKRLAELANPLESFGSGSSTNAPAQKGATVIDGFTIEAVE